MGCSGYAYASLLNMPLTISNMMYNSNAKYYLGNNLKKCLNTRSHPWMDLGDQNDLTKKYVASRRNDDRTRK